LIMIFFTVNPIIFGENLTAKKCHLLKYNHINKNIDVRLLHPVWKDSLETPCDCFTKVIVNRKSKITLKISLRARIRAFH
jgi:hypothetical protein